MTKPENRAAVEPTQETPPIEKRIAHMERYASNGYGNPAFNSDVKWLIAEYRTLRAQLAEASRDSENAYLAGYRHGALDWVREERAAMPNVDEMIGGDHE